VQQSIVILEPHFPAIRNHPSMTRQRPTKLRAQIDSELDDWVVTEAYPEEAWNLTALVMSPPYLPTGTKMFGMLRLANASNEAVTIAFWYSLVDTECAVQHFDGDRPIQEIKDCTLSAPDGLQTARSPVGNRDTYLTITVSPCQLFGEEIFDMQILFLPRG